MKKNIKYISTFIILTIFVLLNWATSQEEDFKNLNASAQIYNQNQIIINNLDIIDINQGILNIVPDQISSIDNYEIKGYNLNAGNSDTIFLNEFVDNNGNSYPDSIPPFSLGINFTVEPIEIYTFYTEL